MNQAKAYDAADDGTFERECRSLLRHSGDWAPQAGPLVVVAPHPKDDVLGAGGLVHSWARAGHAVTVVSVTDGEATDVSRADRRLIRRAELRAALRRLSLLHIEVRSLGVPNGKVRDHQNRLRLVLEELVREPVTLIAPFEHDGHPDHEATSQVTLEIARRNGVPIARYPIWTWHHTNPSSVQALSWGLFRLGTAAQRAKARALQCFDSQLSPLRRIPILSAQMPANFERPFEAFVL